MAEKLLTDATVHAILESARFAPSVHNIQPWLVTSNETSIQLSIDAHHQLRAGDPTGRQTMISLGIFTEAIMLSAACLGLHAAQPELNDKKVVIDFSGGQQTVVSCDDYNQLIRARCTDRSIYTPAVLSEKFLHSIEQISYPGIKVHAVTEQAFIQTVASLTAKGIRMALSSPDFRRELSQFLILPWSPKVRGIAVKSLRIPFIIAILQPWLVRFGLSHNTEANLEKRRWESASGVIIITGEGDMPKHWLAVGQAYLKVSLEIEKAGLAQATSAAIVEASNFHEDIEELLHTKERVLAVLRVGKGSSKKQFSPRLRAKDLITSN